MNKMMNKIRVFFNILLILVVFALFTYIGISFTDGLAQQHQKGLKLERMSFVKDSLEVEYYKLKIDSLRNGK
jgi:hypothetical protein